MACNKPLPVIFSKKKKIAKDGHSYYPLQIGARGVSFAPYIDVWSGEYVEQFSIPCGTCLGCRLDYSRAWADRCAEEVFTSPPESCYFITFSYAPENVAHLQVWQKPDGTLYDQPQLTLAKQDFIDFKKNLLRQFEYHYNHKGIRFYMCGEYGGKGFRPHFHCIFFNLPIRDLKPWSVHYVGNIPIQIYRSEFIEGIWNKGHVWIEKANWANAAYTARYVQKKQGMTTKAFREEFEKSGLTAEYVNMSRMPGIGFDFYEQNRDRWFRQGSTVCLPAHDGIKAKIVRPSRLFIEKYSKFLDDYADSICEESEDVEKRLKVYNEMVHDFGIMKLQTVQQAQAIKAQLLAKTDLMEIEYEDVSAQILERKLNSSLVRHKENFY